MPAKKKTVPPAVAPEGAEVLDTVVPPADLLQVCGLPATDGSTVVLEIVPGDAVAAARQVDAKIQQWLSSCPKIAKALAYHIGVTWSVGEEKAVVAVSFLRPPAES